MRSFNRNNRSKLLVEVVEVSLVVEWVPSFCRIIRFACTYVVRKVRYSRHILDTKKDSTQTHVAGYNFSYRTHTYTRVRHTCHFGRPRRCAVYSWARNDPRDCSFSRSREGTGISITLKHRVSPWFSRQLASPTVARGSSRRNGLLAPWSKRTRAFREETEHRLGREERRRERGVEERGRVSSLPPLLSRTFHARCTAFFDLSPPWIPFVISSLSCFSFFFFRSLFELKAVGLLEFIFAVIVYSHFYRLLFRLFPFFLSFLPSLFLSFSKVEFGSFRLKVVRWIVDRDRVS